MMAWPIWFLLCLAPFCSASNTAYTKCTSGTTGLVGATERVVTVQICNLFGDTCYVNHPQLPHADCGTKALKIEKLQCALYPIKSYKNWNRAGTEMLKFYVDSPSCNGSHWQLTGDYVSVQCTKGSTWAGPGDTTEFPFARLQNPTTHGFKTVVLTRTVDMVGCHSGNKKTRTATGCGSVEYKYLPYFEGNNYGPEACPSSSNTVLMSADATSTTHTWQNLRMCGQTTKWVYFGAMNLLMNANKKTTLTAGSTTRTIDATTTFNTGNSVYYNGDNMKLERKVAFEVATNEVMTSQPIVPVKSSGMATPNPDIAGTWRAYAVIFYCTDYARTDTSTCASSNRAMFYVADPNPAPQFGISSTNIGGSSSTQASKGDLSGPCGVLLVLLALQLAMRM